MDAFIDRTYNRDQETQEILLGSLLEVLPVISELSRFYTLSYVKTELNKDMLSNFLVTLHFSSHVLIEHHLSP